MDDVQEAKAYKESVVGTLRDIRWERYRLDDTDERLSVYARQLVSEPDAHNVYELLSLVKFARLLENYEFSTEKVKKFFRFYESLKFSGISGRKSYKLTPVQAFQFASIYGFYRRNERGERTRLTRRVILFVPRKFSKTTSSASIAFHDLLFGDSNGQAYTGANSYKQAQILFKEIKSIARQLDPRKRYFKINREHIEWLPNKFGKESFAECLTGGADTKDGLAASLFIYDEYAAAYYTADHSEGAELFQAITSSMGTRREPLTIIITTASRHPNGPFALELDNAQHVLRGDYENDTLFASLFMPDAWEGVDDLGSPWLWKKCNPHIGVTVFEDFYRDYYYDAMKNPETMLEFKCKLLNIYVQAGLKQWINNEMVTGLIRDVKSLELGRCKAMCSFDLSVSDDFSAVNFMLYSNEKKLFYSINYYLIPEDTLESHPNRELYKMWAAGGYLKICPGATVDYNEVIRLIIETNKRWPILQIGYDKYKAMEPVNALRSAVGSLGGNPDRIIRSVPNNYGGMNSCVETLEYAIKARPTRIFFAPNPITPYCFGNAYIDEDKLGNKMPQKRKANMKIDGVMTNLMSFWLFNNYEW